MRITKRVTQTVECDEVTDVLCNLCGESCFCDHDISGVGIAETGGWSGTFPPDMERWSLDVCERCIGALFLVCKVQPEVYDASIGCASPMPSGAMWSMLSGEAKCDDSRAVVARLEMIVAAATARLASIKPLVAT